MKSKLVGIVALMALVIFVVKGVSVFVDSEVDKTARFFIGMMSFLAASFIPKVIFDIYKDNSNRPKRAEKVSPYQVKCVSCSETMTIDVPLLKGEGVFCWKCSEKLRKHLHNHR